MYQRLNNKVSGDEVSPEESKTETTDLSTAQTSDSYGSMTPVKDKSVSGFYVPLCGVIFVVMAFLGFFCSTILRQGLNVAIVAMVNQSAVTETNTVTTNVSGQCPREPEIRREAGEFNWDRMQQGILLAAFYYGYEVTQMPGGWLADRFGGKWLFGGGVLLSSVVSLVTPAAARIHIGLLIALRILSGLGEGAMMPANLALIARWSSPQFHSVVVGAIFIGVDTGTIVGNILAGILCDYGFAGGWPSVFYVFGIVGCVWFVCWCFLCYNSPYTHPQISAAEREYWDRMIGTVDQTRHPPTPWRKILTSAPVWALSVTYFADCFFYLTIVICLPLYMHDVLGLNMTTNGLLSAIPFLSMAFVIPIVGLIIDWLRAPGRLSTNLVRKSSCAVGATLAGLFLILFGYTGCNRGAAVSMVFLAIGSEGIAFNSVITNQLDLAPLHSGTIMGLTKAVANLGAIAAPLAVGALTSKQSARSEWQHVFFLIAGVYAFGALVFVIFGSGNRQSWADIS